MKRKRNRHEYRTTSDLWKAVSDKIKLIIELKETTIEDAAEKLGINQKDFNGVLNAGLMPSSELSYRIYRWACYNENFYFQQSIKARKRDISGTFRKVFAKLDPESYKSLEAYCRKTEMSKAEVVTIAVRQFLKDDQPAVIYKDLIRDIYTAMVADRFENDPNLRTVLAIDDDAVKQANKTKPRKHQRLGPEDKPPHQVILEIPLEDGPCEETYLREEIELWR
jgi:hypothetical protein